MNEVFADAYASAEAFGNVWAKVSGSVEASVCSTGAIYMPEILHTEQSLPFMTLYLHAARCTTGRHM